MRDVNWAFGSLGFGPIVKTFLQATAEFFIPEAADDGAERLLDTGNLIDVVLDSTDLEFYMRIQDVFRPHDLIRIRFPYTTETVNGVSTKVPLFDLSTIPSDGVRSEYGGYEPYKSLYLEDDET